MTVPRASNTMPMLVIEHSVTANMPDGQSLPPFIEDGVVWHVVRRTDGCTTWRRLFLSPSLVADWRAASGDQTQAP
jgi:hypothetical protein